MNIILLYLIVISCVSLLYIGFSDDAEARHQGVVVPVSKYCAVNVSSVYSSPITYYNNTRSNPDGSVYPGDAIHFIFKYSGSDTCTSYTVEPLIGSENLTFESALRISNNPEPRSHNIILYEWIPKYLTTKHYYVDTIRYEKCGIERCRVVTEAESSSYSLRADKAATGALKRLIDGARTASTYSLRIETTQSWHLAQDKTQYNIGVDEHVLEDKYSVDRFVSIVKSTCSDLSKNSGCVFGHIEINTDTNTEKQICLFEELDKRGILYNETLEDTYGRDGYPDKNNPPVIYEYSPQTIVTDECILKKSQNTISISVKGTGLSCNNDGECERYTRTDNSSITPNILHSHGDIFFKYLQIYDPDGFHYFNNDGTYYLNDVIGIHSIPDALFKKERAGIITFDNDIIDNTIQIISHTSCNDSLCDVKLSGDKISPSTHKTNNGDMISTHYTNDTLGLASIPHESAMYNLDRYIGLYLSTATPLVVCYDPVVSDVSFWSYLADAGNTSFENRYAAAIKYDGSVGGCKDDPDGLYKDRRVKITDIYSVFIQSDNFGKIINVTNPDVFISDGSSIADLDILDSVRSRMNNYSIADSFTGPIMSINHTIQDVQIDSAGFSRLLFDASLDDDYLEKNFINVTSYNTFGSFNFGGKDAVYLVYGIYEYPWGFFSTPFNVTAYAYLKENIPCEKEFCDSDDVISIALADTDVTIQSVKFSDSVDDNSIGLVDFYLNYHRDDEEFAYMHMADLYDMNVQQNIESHSGEFLLNKTAIYYDGTMQDYLFENNLYGNDKFDSVEQYLLYQSPRVFTEGYYSVDAEISASRDNYTKTNVIAFDNLYMKYPIEYSLNMHPDNFLDIKRATTAVSIPYYLHFGKITNVTINDAPVKNISCNNGCMIILPNDSPIDTVAQNQWGGKITTHNLTSMQLVPYDESIWIELLPMRLFWIFFTLGIVYISYRAVKMIFGYRESGK